MTNKTIIGLFYYCDDSEFVTLEDLERLANRECSHYTMADYLDRRKSTNLTRFNYDPFAGEKIDWRKLKKQVTSPCLRNTIGARVSNRLHDTHAQYGRLTMMSGINQINGNNTMATIEERARDYAVNVTVDELNKDGLDSESFCGILHGYVKGATDQKKIDIEKACEWLSNHSMVDTDLFKKAMEE